MKFQKILIATSVVVAVATSATAPAVAQTLLTANTFSNSEIVSPFEQNSHPLELTMLSVQEMKETEGAIGQLVAVGIMTGTRFIVKQLVTPRVAQNMVARGRIGMISSDKAIVKQTGILAPSRSIAKNIAGRNPIREFHPGSGQRYFHYHPNPRNGTHIWYGKLR